MNEIEDVVKMELDKDIVVGFRVIGIQTDALRSQADLDELVEEYADAFRTVLKSEILMKNPRL